MMDIKQILTEHSKWLADPTTGSRADLREADLRGANLREADLREADLREADLRGADLRGADLREADLREADLREANLREANLPYYSIVPDEGEFIAFKKVRGGIILKLKVLPTSKRINSIGSRKIRVSKVTVLGYFNSQGEYSSKKGKKFYGIYDSTFVYTTGKIVTPDSFNDDIRVECTSGIHCFITKQEAEEY